MKIRTGDIYRINNTKYKWANQFVFGKVLHISCGKYLNYATSKLLLKNNSEEVWNIDILDIQEHITLRKMDKGKIIVQIKNKEELNLIKFDTILAFDVLSVTDNVNETIKFIFEHLNDNGISLISTINDDKLLNSNNDLITKDLNIISKNILQEKLNPYFKNLEFFSHGTVKDNNKNQNITNNLKNIIKKIILTSNKGYNFYLKYLHIIKKNISIVAKNKEDKKTHRYEIILFDEKIKPLFTIVKCRK